MRPLKPEERRRIIENAPEDESEAQVESEIEEYETLISQRFRVDPALPRSPRAVAEAAENEERIRQLHSKLFQFELDENGGEGG